MYAPSKQTVTRVGAASRDQNKNFEIEIKRTSLIWIIRKSRCYHLWFSLPGATASFIFADYVALALSSYPFKVATHLEDVWKEKCSTTADPMQPLFLEAPRAPAGSLLRAIIMVP